MTVLSAARRVPSRADAPALVAMCDDDATVTGEFALRDRFDAALDSGAARVVVDLAPCHYLDAPGLRVLLEARERAAGQGTRLELRGCSAGVRRLLEAAGHPVDQWSR